MPMMMLARHRYRIFAGSESDSPLLAAVKIVTIPRNH
jgi:hypothetical protein